MQQPVVVADVFDPHLCPVDKIEVRGYAVTQTFHVRRCHHHWRKLLKFYMIAVLLFGVLVSPAAMESGIVGLVPSLFAAEECGDDCPRCPRTQGESANTCAGGTYVSSWSGLGGVEGCCFSEVPSCASMPCTWIGNLSVVNNTAAAAKITINGPGGAHGCPNVPAAGFCTKSFDNGPTNPAIVASCPADSKDVTWTVTTGVGCAGTFTFTCGVCP